MTSITHRNQSGFTLIEIVVVIVFIAILATVAVIRHKHVDPTLMSQTQVLKAHIRYAQMRSLSTDSNWGIKYQVNGDQSAYWLFKQPNTNNRIVLPGESEDHVRLDQMGIVISQGSFQVEFDGWGRPSSTLSGTGTLNLELSNSDDSEQIIVTQNTGFIP
ncbi:MAG: prepilin-type N-terminal cleavage/methylation domain-containing protein [Desulfobacteraceae bacterium]|jgi:MSHA pilin protein MshC